jgi:hypothetical protein
MVSFSTDLRGFSCVFMRLCVSMRFHMVLVHLNGECEVISRKRPDTFRLNLWVNRARRALSNGTIRSS